MQKTNSKFLFIIIALITVGLIYLLAPILMPFLAGALIAYLLDPLVEKLRHWRIPRLLSVILVFLTAFIGITVLILVLIPLIQKQIISLSDTIPKAMSWFESKLLPSFERMVGVEPSSMNDTIQTTLTNNLGKAGDIATWLVKQTLQSGKVLVQWTTNLLLIPVVTFYLLRDWPNILRNIRGLLPRRIEPTIVKLSKECDAVLSGFIRGQLFVMLALGAIYSVGLTLMGLQIGLLIGLISGLVSIVPYLGFVVGIVTASIAAYIQFGTVSAVFWVWAVFAVGQTMESTFLTPKLVGNRIGLHPVAVIFAILAGGSLFGFFGVLLALPAAAVMMVWVRFFKHRYQHSGLYQ